MRYDEIIYNLLSNAAAVTAIVSTRIYPIMAKQEAANPMIVYNRNATDFWKTKDAGGDYEVITIELNLYSDTNETAQTLAAATKATLQNHSGTVAGSSETYTIENIELTSQIDLFEPETREYNVSQQFDLYVK